MKTRTRRVLCWVERGFDAWDLAGVCQILSAAGRNWNWRGYRLVVASAEGGSVDSNAQIAWDTVPLSSQTRPDVLVVGGADPSQDACPAFSHWVSTWSDAEVDWLCLRGGLPRLLRQGHFTEATVAASPHLRPQLSELAPKLKFSDDPWLSDGRLRSVATFDASAATLDLVQAHVGGGARRATEASLGLPPSVAAVRLRWSQDPETGRS